jgi:hypothetical protein
MKDIFKKIYKIFLKLKTKNKFDLLKSKLRYLNNFL